MGLFSFFRRNKGEAHFPCVTFVSAPGEKILVKTTWPTDVTAEEADKVVAELGRMVAMICEGELLKTIKESIGLYSKETGSGDIALRLMNHINNYQAGKGHLRDLIVRPTRLFK